VSTWRQVVQANFNWDAVIAVRADWAALLADPGEPLEVEFEVTPDAETASVGLYILAPYIYNTVTVDRYDGTTWVPVRGAEKKQLSGGSWVGVDYEVPLGSTVTYRATLRDDPSGATFVVQRDVVLPDISPGRGRLGNAVDPANAVLTWIEGMDAIDRPTQVGVYEIIGRKLPVVVTGKRGSRRGVLRLLTRDIADRDAMWRLLDEGDTLLLRTGPEYGLGNLYMAIEAVSEQRITPIGYYPARRFTLEFIETGIPVGSLISAADNSWGLLVTGTATWATLKDDRSSWLAVYQVPYPATP
jgi:hypothetical protein